MLHPICPNIFYDYKNKQEVHPLFIFIPVAAAAIFFISQKTLFIFFIAGVHLPHLILALPLIPVTIVLSAANNLYFFLTGKIHDELFEFYKECYKYFVYVFLSLLFIPRQLAPYFKQDDKDFDFTLQISSPENNKRLYKLSGLTGLTLIPERHKRLFPLLRLTGLILIPLLLHIIIIILMTFVICLLVPVNVVLRIFNTIKTPEFIKRYFESYFVNLISLTAFILGFSNKFPELFYRIKKIESAGKQAVVLTQ